MEIVIYSLFGVVIGQFTLLWYKIGKLEGKLNGLNNNLKGGKSER